MKRPIKDMAASVRQKLLNRAKESGRTFDEVLQYYAMERFLYRLSKSSYADKFILKGALAFLVWQAPRARPTKDIDLLGHVRNDPKALITIFQEIAAQDVEPDGVEFHASKMTAEKIAEDADYEGVRLRFSGHLGTARVSMQIDVGFGDVVVPRPSKAKYPTLLDQQAPHILTYSREAAIAEKFEAMIKLGAANSRMKDFYDVWFLSRHFDFDGRALGAAIARTFENRGTPIPTEPTAISDDFGRDPTKQAQWHAFIRKSRLADVPTQLHEVIKALRGFLAPIAAALRTGMDFDQAWRAPGPWA